MDHQRVAKRFRGAFGEAKGLCRGLREVEVELEVCPQYCSHVVSGRARPHVEGFFRCAKGLRVGDLEAWIRSRVVPVVDVVGLLSDLPHPSKPPTLIQLTRRALRRIASTEPHRPHDPSSVRALDSLRELAPAAQVRALKTHPSRRRPDFVATLVDWLDLYRYDWPSRAASLARYVALHLCPEGGLETALRALAVYASAIRMRGSMTLAGMVMTEALPLAYRISPTLEADLTQRASYILRDHARHEESLQASTAAGMLYASVNDHAGQAKVATDRGICLYLRGDYETAEGELRRALAWLPGSARRNRSAARLTLGLSLFGNTRRAEGLREVEQAVSILESPTAYDRASLSYTRAGLARALGRNYEAETLYREAKVLADRFSPFESALITLDLLALLVEQRRLEEAAEEGLTVRRLLQPLRFHPDAQEALLELARLNGQVGLQDIAKARELVSKARREPTPRAVAL